MPARPPCRCSIEALNGDKAAYWACLVLRDIGPDAKDAVPALTEALGSKQLQVPREALLALAAIGPPAASAVPRIAAMIDDGLHRTAATYALGAIGKIPADIEAKVRANAESQDKLLSTASLWTLARLHPEDKEIRRKVTERLVQRLKEQDPNVRAWAAQGLVALPPAPEITVADLREGVPRRRRDDGPQCVGCDGGGRSPRPYPG